MQRGVSKPGQSPLVQAKLDAVLPRPVGSGWNTVKAVHRLVLKELKPLPASPLQLNPANHLAYQLSVDWESFEWTVLCGLSPIWADAGGFAVTALRLCLEAGVASDRLMLAFVATPDERDAARAEGRKFQVDHVVCLFRHSDHQHYVIADGTQVCFEARQPARCRDIYRKCYIRHEGQTELFKLPAGELSFDGWAIHAAAPRRAYYSTGTDHGVKVA